jgi:hypothetical protein
MYLYSITDSEEHFKNNAQNHSQPRWFSLDKQLVFYFPSSTFYMNKQKGQ